MRIPSRRGCVVAGLAALAVALGLPAGTSADQFTVTSSTATTTPATTAPAVTTATATASSSSGGGLSTFDDAAIIVVALAVFGSIAWYIHDDSRLHTPRGTTASIDRERGTVAPRAERVKRARAKAKAARRARRAGR